MYLDSLKNEMKEVIHTSWSVNLTVNKYVPDSFYRIFNNLNLSLKELIPRRMVKSDMFTKNFK